MAPISLAAKRRRLQRLVGWRFWLQTAILAQESCKRQISSILLLACDRRRCTQRVTLCDDIEDVIIRHDIEMVVTRTETLGFIVC